MSPGRFAGMRRIHTTGALVRSVPLLSRDAAAPIAGDFLPRKPTWDTQLVEAQRILDRLIAGWSPDDDDLADAPLLQSWSFASRPDGTSLIGEVFGHPLLGSSQRVATSALIAIDARGLKWARTVSRFYILGRPVGMGMSS